MKKESDLRSIGFIVKNGEVKEVLPKSYKMMSKNKRRKMFFAMLNMRLGLEAQITVGDCRNFDRDIRSIAIDKILSFFQCYRLRPEEAKAPVRILLNESILFDRFFNDIKAPLKRQTSYFKGVGVDKGAVCHPAFQLINILFLDTGGALLDLDEMFAYTVFKRIKPSETAVVSMENGHIHIDNKGVRTRICARWKRMSMDRLFDDDRHIDNGIKQLGDEDVNACYLVYPKMDDFKKHIIVEHSKEGFLKVIPYSFTFCNQGEMSA